MPVQKEILKITLSGNHPGRKNITMVFRQVFVLSKSFCFFKLKGKVIVTGR